MSLEKKLILTNSSRDFYRSNNILYTPIKIDFDVAETLGVKYLKVVALPSKLQKRLSKDRTSNIILPYNLSLSTNNEENLSYKDLGNNNTPNIVKKFFSNNITRSGQNLEGLPGTQLYKKHDIQVNKINNTVLCSFPLRIARRNFIYEDTLGNEKESGHFFYIYALDESLRIIDLIKISGKETLNSYNLNDLRADNEVISIKISQLLNSIKINFQNYVFDNRNQIVESSGPNLTLSTSAIDDIIRISNNTINIFKINFEYQGEEFDFKIDNISNFKNKIISDGYKFVKSIWENIVSDDLDEIDMNLSLTVPFSDFSIITKNITLSKDDVRVLYNGYEVKNKVEILKKEFSDRIDIERVIDNSFTNNLDTKIFKITFNKVSEYFKNHTTLGPFEIKIKSKVGRRNTSMKFGARQNNRDSYIDLVPRNNNIFINRLYFDSSFNVEDNFINAYNDVFNYSTLFENTFTNIFYYKSDFRNNNGIEIFINNINASDQSLSTIDLINSKSSSTIVSLQDFLSFLSLERNSSNDIRETKINLSNRFISIKNKLAINTDGLSDSSARNVILENTLFEIKTRYSSLNGNEFEIKKYDLGSNLFDNESLSCILNDKDIISSQTNLSKNVEIKIVTFNTNTLSNLTNPDASDDVKESFINTLNDINSKKYSYFINKIEDSYFRTTTNLNRTYNEIFKIFSNMDLPESSFSVNFVENAKLTTDEKSEEDNINLLNNRAFKLEKSIFTNVKRKIEDLFLDYNRENDFNNNFLDFNTNIDLFVKKNKSSFLLEKIFKNKNYFLKIDFSEKDYVGKIKELDFEVFHHVNFAFYNKEINKSSTPNKDYNIIEDKFLVGKHSTFINSDLLYTFQDNNMLINGSKNKLCKFNLDFYNNAKDCWSVINRKKTVLNLDFVLEKYIIVVKDSTGKILDYLTVTNIIKISDNLSKIMNRKSNKGSNLKINLLSSKSFKPNMQIFYN